MTKVILIRHGESVTNREGIMAGHLDVELTQKGHAQAEKTAEYIVQNYKVDKLYSSDLKRTMSTIKPLSDKLNIEVTPNKNIREIQAGKWDNHTFAEIKELFADDYNIWANDIVNARCTDGESIKEIADRVIKEFTQIARQNDGKTIVCATHGIPIKVMQCISMYPSLDGLKQLHQVSNAAVSEFEYQNGKWHLIAAGIDEHIGDLRTNIKK